MSIHATLQVAPTRRNKAHEMIYITRGASAQLTYPLKLFSIDDIDQITFILKQGRDLYGYSALDEAAAEKKVSNAHFYYDADYKTLIFNLDSEETKQFKAGINIEFEVVIKLNTDSFTTTGNKDSIVIEPQHPIAVVDSLYSKI